MKCLVEDSKTLIDWFDINWMQADPEKFQALAIGKKTIDKKPVFEINDVKISCDETVKLLGVEIDYLMKFDSHISSICRKAAQQINILKRLGKYLTKLNKLTIFHTFIVSNFNYCPLSWHFCSERNTKKLEQANSENCGPPLGNKFDLEEGQRSPSRSRHGTIGKVLSQGTHMPSIKALSVIVQKLWPRLKFL